MKHLLFISIIYFSCLPIIIYCMEQPQTPNQQKVLITKRLEILKKETTENIMRAEYEGEERVLLKIRAQNK